MSRRIRHVDAFTTVPLEGNPAAVVDGEGLDPEVMQQIALTQKLSETVFLLKPEQPANHARLRIFTPLIELPFAGHPTLSATHILHEEGIVALDGEEPLRLETGAGVIPVSIGGEPSLYTMTQAAAQFRPAAVAAETIASAIGLPPSDVVRVGEVSTGMWWLLAQVASLDAMKQVRPDPRLLHDLQISIFCIGANAPGVDVHVRTFAVPAGVPEDPVTGSANGCIGAFIAEHQLMPEHAAEIRYVAEQGEEMGQPGRVHVRIDGAGIQRRVHVGGNAVTVLRGELLV